MVRDIEFIRECLMDIEENAKPLEFYNIGYVMTSKGYDSKFSFAQLLLMEQAGLFDKVVKDNSLSFSVMGLSNRGYDFLENISNNEVWDKTKKEIKEKKLPKTIEFIAKVAGVFFGELIKHKNGD